MILAETTRSKPASRRPITSHPLFPVIVVLWSGALFGLASLAIRTELIEHAVVSAGIDGVVPMAAPPLGKTARLLIALLATGLGCLVGFIAMRRFAKPRGQVTPSRRRHSATVVPAQEDVLDEPASPIALFGGARRDTAEALSEDEAEVEPEAPARRRRFSMAREETQPEPDVAPLPGAQIFKVADLDPDAFETAADDDTPRWVHTIDQSNAEPSMAATAEISSRETSLFDSYVRGVKPSEPAKMTPQPGFELLEGDEMSASQDVPAQEPVASAIARTVHARAGTAAERIAAAPLDTLSHVELLERLALTIERRRAAAAAARANAKRSTAAPQPEAPAMPAALLPVELDALAPQSDSHNDDEALPGYVPPRHIGAGDIAPPADDNADEVLSQGYSSLRNFSRPPAEPAAERTGVRFDTSEPRPVSIVSSEPAPASSAPRLFDAPGLAAADPQHAEQELRDALATLQRMSGAA